MASPLMNISLRTFECPICLCHWTDPRNLACNHVFCKVCLEGMITQPSHRIQRRASGEEPRPVPLVPSLKCPVCKKRTGLKADGIDGLGKPLYLKEIQQNVIRYHIEQEAKNKKCLECKESEKQLTHYCFRCTSKLCEDCSTKHKTHPLLTSHRVEQLTEVDFCSIHEKEAAEIYCEACSSIICELCVTQSHSGHQCKTAELRLEELQTKIASMEKSISHFDVKRNNDILERIVAIQDKDLRHIDDLLLILENTCENLHEMRNQVKASGDVAERFLKNEIDIAIKSRAKMQKAFELVKSGKIKNMREIETLLIQLENTASRDSGDPFLLTMDKKQVDTFEKAKDALSCLMTTASSATSVAMGLPEPDIHLPGEPQGRSLVNSGAVAATSATITSRITGVLNSAFRLNRGVKRQATEDLIGSTEVDISFD